MLKGAHVDDNSLVGGFLRSARTFPSRPALDVEGEVYTYERLSRTVFAIAGRILASGADEPYGAVLGYRSLSSYAGVLGVLAAGKGYVPLNPTLPVERLSGLLSMSACSVLIVGKECRDLLPALLQTAPKALLLIFPDARKGDFDEAALRGRRSVFLAEEGEESPAPALPRVSPGSSAYLLFTSGSTGVPKGVAVSHANAKAFVDYVCARYAFNENDRFSQTADLNFDLSILELFPCWERGGCLCCLPKGSVMAPAKYIRDKKLTVWVSVPSVGIFLSKMRLLKPDAFPTLRYCLFCGEPLLASITEKWQQAAPSAVIENLYGPTEATVAITTYRWDSSSSPAKSRNDVVPIGWTFEGQQSCIVDERLNVLEGGEVGELCLAGSQVTKGYYNNPEKTDAHFVTIPRFGETSWYRTGDLVQREADGCMHYLGRIDNQVKVMGYRVELQEIDHVLRRAAGSELAVAVARMSEKEKHAEGIIGFIGGNGTAPADKQAVLDACLRALPKYMVPEDIVFVETMPLNANGKIDRKELLKQWKGSKHER